MMCYALKLGLATDNHIWILPAWFSEGWWDRADDIDWNQYNCSCTSNDIIEAVKYSLLVDAFSFLRNESIVSDSGYVSVVVSSLCVFVPFWQLILELADNMIFIIVHACVCVRVCVCVCVCVCVHVHVYTIVCMFVLKI